MATHFHLSDGTVSTTLNQEERNREVLGLIGDSAGDYVVTGSLVTFKVPGVGEVRVWQCDCARH